MNHEPARLRKRRAQIVSSTADLAPGDAASAAVDLAPFRIDRIRALDDPLFETAHALVWAEFGAKHEMELRATLGQRRAAPARPTFRPHRLRLHPLRSELPCRRRAA